MTEFIRRFIEAVNHPILVLDSDLRVRTVNGAFCRTFNVQPTEMEDRPVFDGDGSEAVAQLCMMLHQTLANGDVFERFEIEYVFPTIGRRAMRLNGYRLGYQCNRSPLVLVTVQDVTEQGQVQAEALQVQDQGQQKPSETAHATDAVIVKYRDALILANIRDAVYMTDLDGVVTYWNEGCTRLFGWTAEEKIGRPVNEHLPEAESAAIIAAVGAIREGRDIADEWLVSRKDGSQIWVDVRVSLIRDEQGRPLRILGLSHDISDRKRAEESLRQSQERLRVAIETTGLGLLDYELATGTVEYSPGWKRQLGYEPHEISKRIEEWESRLHPFDRERALDALRGYLAGRRSEFALEFRLRHKDGSYRWIYMQASGLRGENGMLTRVIACHVDVTERKRLEEQFRQAQKMEAVGQLAGGVAHDFNNLLTIISGYSEILLPGLPTDDPRREMIGQIHEAGERAAALTRQLLAFSRKAVLEPKILDLNELVREHEKMLRRLIGEDVELTTTLDSALSPVKADPGQVGQIIMNLAVNARDAMPTGGKLTIETGNVTLDEAAATLYVDAKPGPYVLVAMSDTGVGMPPHVKARIFEPFFTTKGPGKGTGLGLATVYGIVKQSGGFISVHSESNRGTAFKIYFPATLGHVSTGKSSAGIKPAANGTETILLVEDEVAVRSMVRSVLTRCGYTVLDASSGAEALGITRQYSGTIHLLITDVVMPGMSGRELVEKLALRRSEIKVLYLSGFTDDAVVRHGVLQAEVAFLRKPFTLAALTYKVREVLDGANPGQSLGM